MLGLIKHKISIIWAPTEDGPEICQETLYNWLLMVRCWLACVIHAEWALKEESVLDTSLCIEIMPLTCWLICRRASGSWQFCAAWGGDAVTVGISILNLLLSPCREIKPLLGCTEPKVLNFLPNQNQLNQGKKSLDGQQWRNTGMLPFKTEIP